MTFRKEAVGQVRAKKTCTASNEYAQGTPFFNALMRNQGDSTTLRRCHHRCDPPDSGVLPAAMCAVVNLRSVAASSILRFILNL
jgi:hypothetical protein